MCTQIENVVHVDKLAVKLISVCVSLIYTNRYFTVFKFYYLTSAAKLKYFIYLFMY